MEFHCAICAFTTHKKYNFEKHLKSQRHFINEKRPKVATKLAEVIPPVEVNPVAPASDKGFKCKHCGKCYNHLSSLSKHVNHSCIKNEKNMIERLNKLIEQQQGVIEQQNKIIEDKTKHIDQFKQEVGRLFNFFEKKDFFFSC